MKVSIYSLGCKVNLYESEYVTNLLKDNGYEIVSFNETADIYIVNTCTVTNESDRKSRKVINSCRKKNKNAIVIAMGCYSQIKHNDVDADIIVGNKYKSDLINIIDDFINKKNRIDMVCDLQGSDFEDMEINSFANHSRAFVKIQDGCNAFCTYCIIPYSRGPIRSKSEDKVIEEITNLVNNGYKEIVLTGIHTGKYGADINSSLEKLLSKIILIKGLYRVRLSSIEINEITDGILDLMKKSNIIANHLHIPLQSGSNTILKSMNRKYDKEYFINRIEEIRKIRNDISITTDLIVGFPGETDELFLETLDTIEKLKFMHIHTFPYSKRDGTVAASMENQINGLVKKERVHKVLEISNKYEEEFYKNSIGCIYDGVVEKRKDGRFIVHTSNFIPVNINSDVVDNDIVKVRVLSVDNLNVYGEIVRE